MSEPIRVVYGLTVMNPQLHVRFRPPEPLTWQEVIHSLLVKAWWVFSQSFLFALSVTCFMFAAGAFR